MIKEPYIRIKTIDYSNLSDTVPDSLNVAMVINSDTGPTAVTKITNATQLIKYYSTKQQLNITDDVTFKHAAKLLQFTPIYLTRAFDNSVIAGYTDRGDLIYTDLEYNHLPFRLKVVIPEPKLNTDNAILIQSINDEELDIGTTNYDEYIARINSRSGITHKFFKVSKTEDKWTLISKDNSINSSSLSEVSNRFISDWSWINFDDGTISASDYICINGRSFYPSNSELSTGNEQYPNIAIGVPIRGTKSGNTFTPSDGAGGFLDYQLGLLELFNSGNYGLSEAWGFTDGFILDKSGLTVDATSISDDVKLFVDYSTVNKITIYPNNLKFTSNGKNFISISIPSSEDDVSNVYTLPYVNKDDDSTKHYKDTSEIHTLYGLMAYIAREESGVTYTASKGNIYIKNTEVESYSVGTQLWTDKKLNDIEDGLESILPTELSLSSESTIGHFWIRIQDYVFYNMVIDDLTIANNPNLEQIKISSVELTYKQFLVKLRKKVGDVFNTTNTENGFTLFWRSMPDRTKFGSSMTGSIDTNSLSPGVEWNGKLLINGNARATLLISEDNNGSITGLTINPNGKYTEAPIAIIEGGNGKADILLKLDSNNTISNRFTIINKGLGYNQNDKVIIKPAVQIIDDSIVAESARFAVVARFPSKDRVLGFSYIRQDLEVEDGNPLLYTFTLYYKGQNLQESTLAFDPDDAVDEFGVSRYFTYFNDINDFVQLVPLNGELNFKKFEKLEWGDEIPVVEPEEDDYKSAADRFKAKDGTYYDFVFDGGYVNAGYAKHLVDICKGGSEDSLWAQAMLSCIDDKDYKDRIAYRDATQVNNCNGQMFGDWVVDNTIADFSIDISATAIALEKIFANRDSGKEFACIFGPANGAMTYKPKYPIIDKDIREKLVNKQINTLIWDNSLGLSYFNLDITMQLLDSSMSDCNNVRTVNCQAHIADNYLKWYWGRVNDEATRNEVIQGLRYRIDQRCVNNQQYHIDDYIIVCNETNNPDIVVENRQLVVDIKDKFRPGIRYIHVFNKIYRLTQDFDSIG